MRRIIEIRPLLQYRHFIRLHLSDMQPHRRLREEAYLQASERRNLPCQSLEFQAATRVNPYGAAPRSVQTLQTHDSGPLICIQRSPQSGTTRRHTPTSACKELEGHEHRIHPRLLRLGH